jgi:hypothetical protein
MPEYFLQLSFSREKEFKDNFNIQTRILNLDSLFTLLDIY